jgi:hypothetical protein
MPPAGAPYSRPPRTLYGAQASPVLFRQTLFYDLKFDELMGPIIDRVTNNEMVERGISAKPTIEVHSFNGTASVLRFQKPGGKWQRLSSVLGCMT